MFERRMLLSMAVLVLMILLLPLGQASAQTAAEQDSARVADQAQVGDIEGEVTTNFEFAITGGAGKAVDSIYQQQAECQFFGSTGRAIFPLLLSRIKTGR